MNPLTRPHPSLPSPWAEAVDPDQATLADWARDASPPIIWSVAGTDSGGGAGLSADTRAAAALGVHLCPVVAAVTAQHSRGVQAVFALPREQIQAQLRALAEDMPPRVVKTGLLGSAAAITALCEAVDALRLRDPELLLVVDPVLGASSGGAAFCDEAVLQAYRNELLPRCNLLTPNRREALRLLGLRPDDAQAPGTPELAAALVQRFGPQRLQVCITGGDDLQPTPGADALALDWVQARALPSQPVHGWLALPRLPVPHSHGTGCSFASAAAAALARGFAMPDVLVLAKRLVWQALQDGHAAGTGAGPVRADARFMHQAQNMPVMGFDDEHSPAGATLARWLRVLQARPGQPDPSAFKAGLYGISADPAQLAGLAASGRFAHLQLRLKSDGRAELTQAIGQALKAVQAHPGCQLWINDHWQIALEQGATALHLGQEDWAALEPAAREQVLGKLGLKLGLSSHSLWELARARGLAPHYIACGPIWPTTTKHMPWLPQGLGQLHHWVAMAGAPVVAIGGLLSAGQLHACLQAGAAAVCLVRGLGDEALLATSAIRHADFA
ncbi:bifunctional hydroxymethylpyrimidine kinase/phosphomethylpyrimidine kinase [Roseateles sp.]|jgi:hydroxymethylpyrimidine kinase/phosphomethylpyrimidine kinase/thiamine-phosphate diphosphorylase|uniref:bifunctional hydroxymethylpyrimidine kinase/phosphomethylpyrimidine kinase n=1 Tax=Roseateles sp. TaxID=1971397 RepID=UPI0037C86E4E